MMMNFKKSAKNLEKLFDEEFSLNPPLAQFNDIVVFKNYKIYKNNHDNWVLSRNSDTLHIFKLKSSAILAIDYYDKRLYKMVEEIKILDSDYWCNIVDVSFFKNRLQNCPQSNKDIFKARLDVSSTKAKYIKNEIVKRIRHTFC